MDTLDVSSQKDAPVDGVSSSPVASPASATDAVDIEEEIKRQVEFYLSKENFTSNPDMVAELSADMYLPISSVANLPSLKEITSDVDLILNVIRKIPYLTVDEEGKRVKPDIERPQRNRIILRDVPDQATEEDIRGLFNSYTILDVKAEVGNSWFVTLATDDEAKNAILGLAGRKLHDAPVRARIKSNTIVRSAYTGAASAAYSGGFIEGEAAEAYGSVGYSGYNPYSYGYSSYAWGYSAGGYPAGYAAAAAATAAGGAAWGDSANGSWNSENTNASYSSGKTRSRRDRSRQKPSRRAKGGNHSKGNKGKRSKPPKQAPPVIDSTAQFPPLPSKTNLENGYTGGYKKFSMDSLLSVLDRMEFEKPNSLPSSSDCYPVLDEPISTPEVKQPPQSLRARPKGPSYAAAAAKRERARSAKGKKFSKNK